MSTRTKAVAVVASSAALIVACDLLVLAHHLHRWPHGYTYWLEGTVAFPVWAVIGLLIVFRVPGNRLGWVALGCGVAAAVHLFAGSLATYLMGPHAPTEAVDVLAGVAAVGQVGAIGGLILFAQLIPDGRPVARRWSVPLLLSAAGCAATAASNALSTSGVRNLVPTAQPPVRALAAGLPFPVMVAANVAVLTGICAAVGGLVVRWRRGTSLQRQQLKWVLFTGGSALLLVFVAQPVIDRADPHATVLPTLMWSFIAASLPAGTVVAVLRYRLYDIDRIVSRTFSYLVVTAVVVGVYVAAVALADDVLPVSSAIGVAASTLLAAAVFQPVRRRVQRVIDRRFNRQAYDARRVVDAFANRLRDEVDVDEVRRDLLTTVGTAMAPGTVSLWVTS